MSYHMAWLLIYFNDKSKISKKVITFLWLHCFLLLYWSCFGTLILWFLLWTTGFLFWINLKLKKKNVSIYDMAIQTNVHSKYERIMPSCWYYWKAILPTIHFLYFLSSFNLWALGSYTVIPLTLPLPKSLKTWIPNTIAFMFSSTPTCPKY